MSKQDYRIAYKFLKDRATKSGIVVMKVLDECPFEQKERIMQFLTRQHQVRFL